ncbi:MAG: biopolymer transporter ExbD, partial [Flavobacteriaceae bacterium]|nr:biopolymer transporter ExbD [Flavobacteriaceae bacterium]
SMADIAFLLLIFFLVTTTMEVDSGILRKIPEKQENQPRVILKEKNVLDITISNTNKLLVENIVINVKDLKQLAIDFIDNGGGLDKNNTACDWCNGKKDPTSSDHPTKAFIAIQSGRNASYGYYISVLNQLIAANTFLRNKLSQKLYQEPYNLLLEKYKSGHKDKESIKLKIDHIREKYPLLVSDIENTK